MSVGLMNDAGIMISSPDRIQAQAQYGVSAGSDPVVDEHKRAILNKDGELEIAPSAGFLNSNESTP